MAEFSGLRRHRADAGRIRRAGAGKVRFLWNRTAKTVYAASRRICAAAHRAAASPFLIFMKTKPLAPSCGAQLRHRRKRRLAGRRPRRQPLLPSSATGGGRKRCLLENGRTRSPDANAKTSDIVFPQNDFLDKMKQRAAVFDSGSRLLICTAPRMPDSNLSP